MKQDSWLYSDSFLKRCLAIYGYSLVGGLIISIPVVLLFMILGTMFAFRIGDVMERKMMEQEMMDVDFEMAP